MNKEMYDKQVHDEIGKIVKPILDKVLQEKIINHMMVGGSGKIEPRYVFIQPHNYRRYYDFSKADFKPPKPYSTMGMGYGYGIVNKTEHVFKNFKNCTVRVKKQTIEITNKINHKAWHKIDIYNAYSDVRRVIEAKEYEIIAVLTQFMTEFGGSSKFSLKSHRQEIKVTGDAITRKIDKNLNWHTEHHKKVYKEQNVEFYDINKVITLLNNSILYENMAELREPIEELANGMGQLLVSIPKGIEQLKAEIHTKEDAYRNKHHLEKLNDDDKFEMMKLLKKRIFGG